MKQPFCFNQPGSFRLKDIDPDFCGGLDKDKTRAKTAELCQRIDQLQDRLYANGNQSLLLIFQGMDTSGKDGATRRVLEFVDPAGTEVTSFKTPSSEERAHDFLWRIHKAVPRYGNIGIFNRSHYEEVLIVRVLKMVKEKVWRARYEEINAFEKHLSENRVIMLKFFLHISKKEQAERLRERLENPRKQWKFSVGDLEMRKKWNEFMKAYEDVVNRCSTPWAPWHVIPANRNWYRDHLIANIVVEKLESLNLKWPKAKEDLSQITIE